MISTERIDGRLVLVATVSCSFLRLPTVLESEIWKMIQHKYKKNNITNKLHRK
jgi:hypothetical protein